MLGRKDLSDRDIRVIAIDQGTTATKSYLLDMQGNLKLVASIGHTQILPQRGWVEHDPETLLANIRSGIATAGQAAAIGIDNQGETVVAWDAQTGRPVYNAIVWQDTRTNANIDALKAAGAEAETLARAGLPLDAYFAASKMRWILDNVAEAQELARQNRLRLGTSDAFFLDRLSGEFATDPSTASRTSLMNLSTLKWDETLCQIFGVPVELLPEIRPTVGIFGSVDIDGAGVPIVANIVDQTAALFGHRCFETGRTKITFGTGAFALKIVGPKPSVGNSGVLLSVATWQFDNQLPSYALEGGVYSAGSAVNWAKAQGFFDSFEEIDSFETPSAISRGVVFVPALSGLACPQWDRNAAGLFIGLGLATTKADMCQALLEGIAMRATQVITEMGTETGGNPEISIDGGLSNNRYFCQFLADALGREIIVPATSDATGLGTAWMALLGAGLVASPSDLPLPAGQPQRVTPKTVVTSAQHELFAEAVNRASGWWGLALPK
jgi:glycerol kinase